MRVIKGSDFTGDKKYKVVHVDEKSKEVVLKEKGIFSDTFASVAAGAIGAVVALTISSWISKK